MTVCLAVWLETTLSGHKWPWRVRVWYTELRMAHSRVSLLIWCRYMPMSRSLFDRYFNIDTVSRILAYPNDIYDSIFRYLWMRVTLGMSVVLVASHISQN